MNLRPKIRYGAKTDIGKVRAKNEDAYLVKGEVFAVADGMGGHFGGKTASELGLKTFANHFKKDHPKEVLTHLAKSIKQANKAIYEQALSKPQLRGMGTTLTAVVFQKNQAYFGHVGDSRAYLFREKLLSQLTEDHSLVAQMVREGKLTPKEAEIHPLKSIITRALGSLASVKVDLISFKVRSEDKILLCTDGLNIMLSDSEIETVLRKDLAPQKSCEKLLKMANLRGALDNITVVLIEIGE